MGSIKKKKLFLDLEGKKGKDYIRKLHDRKNFFCYPTTHIVLIKTYYEYVKKNTKTIYSHKDLVYQMNLCCLTSR